MTTDEISKLAYSGEAPESGLAHEWLLWYRLRDLYGQVRKGEMTREKGRIAKEYAVQSYEKEKAQFERTVLLWQRIEQAALQYATSEGRTPEGDSFYKAVYGIAPAKMETEANSA